MSDFMTHEIVQEHFYRIGTDTCEEYLIPESVCNTMQTPDNPESFQEYTECGNVVDVESVFGFFCRLSASGYTDSTDWIGPFDTESEAKAELEKDFDLF
jgi:hypothetical protein